VSFDGLMGSVVDILGSNQGLIALTVAALVAFASPLVDRFVFRRKRIQYQVLYNSKIGLDNESKVGLDPKGKDDNAALAPRNRQLHQVMDRLRFLSIMMIKIRNTGISDIVGEDFQHPLEVTFADRVVWDARVSDATTESLREHVRENLEFFTDREEGDPGTSDGDLNTLRNQLPGRIAESEVSEQQWHGVRLQQLSLHRKQSFILVLVLHESATSPAGAELKLSKQYKIKGGHESGVLLSDGQRQRRFRWQLAVSGVGVLLVGVLVASLLLVSRTPGVPGVPCGTGTVRLAGSSAFGPTVQSLGRDYMATCPDVTVAVDNSGSITGVRALAGDGAAAALSDGPATDQPGGLDKQEIAVLIYSLVINRQAGVHALSTAQVQGLFAGRYTNWSQLGGRDLPISLVGRTAGSGTRRTFEQYVLGNQSEGDLTSDDCKVVDRVKNTPAPPLCERDTTEEQVKEVAGIAGAIGYADVLNPTTQQQLRAGTVTTVEIDGHQPDIDAVTTGAYPFWTAEYLYTVGTPPTGSALADFLTYLQSAPAQQLLRTDGYTPCIGPGGVLNVACAQR
jgi:phosphate transport system substrate-binding protein